MYALFRLVQSVGHGVHVQAAAGQRQGVTREYLRAHGSAQGVHHAHAAGEVLRRYDRALIGAGEGGGDGHGHHLVAVRRQLLVVLGEIRRRRLAGGGQGVALYQALVEFAGRDVEPVDELLIAEVHAHPHDIQAQFTELLLGEVKGGIYQYTYSHNCLLYKC